MPGKARPHPNGPESDASPSRLAAQAAELLRAGLQWEGSTHNSTHLRSVTIYPPSSSRNGMFLIVGKAWHGGYKMVAFHRAPNILAALLGFFWKVANQKIEWKPDTFAER